MSNTFITPPVSDTPLKIKIQDKEFLIPKIFFPGMTIEVEEAVELNKIANARIQAGMKEAFKNNPALSEADAILLLGELVRNFTFKKPVEQSFVPSELATAKTLIRNAMRLQGRDMKKYTKAQITEAAKNYLRSEDGYAAVQRVLNVPVAQFVQAA